MAYHHGDARTALLKAAGDLLKVEGAAGLSLRQVAERAGLSRQAPYNHFADKQALMAELVREGFETLGRLIDAETSGGKPVAQLARAAEAYIRFGQESPALFRLMFGKELVDLSRHPLAREAASAAFSRLSGIVEQMTSGDKIKDGSLVAWSLVHGYTSLCIETGLEGSGQRQQRARLFAQTLEALTHAPAPAIPQHQSSPA